LFLQDLLGVPTDFQYILYKYGPFSRELREELALMRGNGFLQLVPQPAPYGPTLQVTDIARAQLIGRWPKTLKRYQRELDFVAKHLGGLGVGELEKLATALWVRTNEPDVPLEEHAEDINNLKPHVSKAQALDALRQVEKMEHEASELLAS